MWTSLFACKLVSTLSLPLSLLRSIVKLRSSSSAKLSTRLAKGPSPAAMGRRGPLRTGLRDRLAREKASTSKRPKESPSKRLKASNSSTNDRPTPFVSTTTGQVYTYNCRNEEANTFLKCTPVDSHIEVPASASAFLMNAASKFATAVNDVIVSPEFLVVNLTMNPEKLPQYYKFCMPGKHRIPNSDCFLQVMPSHMEDILSEEYGFNFDLLDDEESDFMETSSSDYSDLEIDPIPKRPTDPATLTELPAESPAAAEAPKTAATTAFPAPAKAVIAADISPKSAIASPTDQSSSTPAATKTPSTSKPRGKQRFHKVDFSKIDIEVPPPNPMLTIIFRTINEADSLKKVNPMKMYKELVSKGGEPQETRDIRNGGLAIDFLPDTQSGPLLSISTLQGIQVTASLPITKSATIGVIKGVHWELTEDEIITETKTTSDIKIISAKRLAKPDQKSWVVKLTFQGLTLPEKAFLAGRSHRIHAYLERPLQCLLCARYGHAARVCRSTPRCFTCGENHESKSCENQAVPICAICGGPHPANSNECPNRGFQTKIAEVKATLNCTFKAARKAVTAAAKSYAAALKDSPTSSKTTEAPAIRPAPANRPVPAYKPSVAHPRPKPTPADATSLANLFQGLVAILTAAIATGDFQGALSKMAALFLSNAPGADPDLFRISP